MCLDHEWFILGRSSTNIYHINIIRSLGHVTNINKECTYTTLLNVFEIHIRTINALTNITKYIVFD